MRQIVEERGADHVNVAVTDMHGLLRGKYKFLSSLDGGFGIPPLIFALDNTDAILEVPGVSDASSGFHNGVAHILPETCR